MNDHEKAMKAAQLSREIKEKEAELTALFGGEPVRQRAAQKCGLCQSSDHNARNCPTKKESANGDTGAVAQAN